MNHNQILGVGQSASAGEIQSAFRKAAMEVHPDHSNSPEAAEAFARIKEARDELMKRAEQAGKQHDSASVQRSTNAAVRATTNATTYSTSITNSLFDGMTPEEVAHDQLLDQLVREQSKRSLFRRVRESTEVAKHRKKLKTNERRLRGLY